MNVRAIFVFLCGLSLIPACNPSDSKGPKVVPNQDKPALGTGFQQKIQEVNDPLLYEGLPHQLFETKLLKKELRTKSVKEWHGYPFYKELLKLSAEDGQRLTQILSHPQTYQPWLGEAKCGGFHPDFALEWRDGENQYLALICFGCEEVKLFEPGTSSRYRLSYWADQELKKVLKHYRQNRVGKRWHPRPGSEADIW